MPDRATKQFFLMLLLVVSILTIYIIYDIGRSQTRIVTGKGETIGKRQGGASAPKIIVDTLRLISGRAKLTLKKNFRQSLSSTAPSARGDIIWTNVQRLVSKTNAAVANKSYAVYYSPKKDTVYVVSSDAADTSKVSITLLVR